MFSVKLLCLQLKLALKVSLCIRVPSPLRKWVKQWNSLAQQIFKADYSRMRRWEAWLDWIVNKFTGLTICGGLIPYPIENIREVAEVNYNISVWITQLNA